MNTEFEKPDFAETLSIYNKALIELANVKMKRKRQLELESRDKRYYTYLVYDGKYYKIGKSLNPDKRLKELRTANPSCELICYGEGVDESFLHDYYFRDRVAGEWFDLTKDKVENIKRLIDTGCEIKSEPSKSKYGWRLSDQEKLNIQQGIKKSLERNKKYIINFGKYKGTRIIDMKTPEQIKYCEWFINNIKEKTMSKGSLKKDTKYKIFSWWLKEFSKINETAY